MVQLRLDHVTKSYQDTPIIHDLNLSVSPKDFVVMVGPSGCGKSTILRLIAGSESLSAGEIYMADKPISHLPPKDRDIAMVFQNYALYPHMTVYDNIAYGLVIRKTPRDKIKTQVLAVAHLLDLEHLLARKPRLLSGGQRQRVAMARAMVRHPTLFLFDEPLSNLDSQLRLRMRLEIKKLHQQIGATSLYVTHDQSEAMTLADQVLVLKAGVVQQCATPFEVYHEPANLFVATFMGSPPMNVLPVFFDPTTRQLCFQNKHVLMTVSENHLLMKTNTSILSLGIRSEDLSISATPTGLVLCVDLIESLGADVYVCGTFLGDDGKHLYRFRLSDRFQLPTMGEKIFLHCDEARLHFFDGTTGDRLKENTHAR